MVPGRRSRAGYNERGRLIMAIKEQIRRSSRSQQQGSTDITLTAEQLAAETNASLARCTRVLRVAKVMVNRYAEGAPTDLKNEAAIRFGGYLLGSDYGGIARERGGPGGQAEFEYAINHADAFRRSGAAMLLTPYRGKARRARWVMWPFNKTEKRSTGGDFAQSVISYLQSQAAGTDANVAATSAIEAAAGALSRGFRLCHGRWTILGTRGRHAPISSPNGQEFGSPWRVDACDRGR